MVTDERKLPESTGEDANAAAQAHAPGPSNALKDRIPELRHELAELERASVEVLAIHEDVARRLLSDNALCESEERFRIVAEQTGQLVYDYGLDTGEVIWAGAMKALTGYDPAEFSTIDLCAWEQLIHPEDREEAAAALVCTKQLCSTYHREYRLRRADGSYVHVEDTGGFLPDAEGRPYRMLGSMRDIDERKRLERAAQESEERFRIAFRTSPDSININRLSDGLYIDVNDGFSVLTGYAAEEVLGKSSLELDIWADPRDRAALVEGLRNFGEVGNLEAAFRLKDGRVRTGLMSARVIRLGGEPHILSVTRDIEERKLMEQDLRESRLEFQRLYEQAKRAEELYRSLLDSSPNAIVIYDLTGKVRYVNRAFSELFGWTIDELAGESVPYVPESEREASMAVIQGLLTAGIPCSGFETKRFTKEGNVVYVSVSASRHNDHEGNPAGMLVVLVDISEKRRLEEQLLQAGKMEAVGQLAGGIAHDFNNFLQVIMGYSNMMLHGLPQDDPNRAKIADINAAAAQAASLTRQLLAFSRKQVLELKVLNLNRVINDLEQILRRVTGEGISTVTSYYPVLHNVKADPTQVQQILLNLAVNARDAMPNGGKLTIETANVVLDEHYQRAYPEVKPGPYVMVAVSDNGAGIDESTRSRIFEPFFTTKPKGRGTGLGLSTVFGIVKQHQGHVSVYSELAKGTTFRIYLPAAPEKTDVTTPTFVPQNNARGTETILVVEDERMVRKLTTEVLKDQGYSVLEAAGPEDALMLSREYPGEIDLVVTDVVLPGMDGKSLFHLLLQTRKELKVLYVSGYAENAIVHHGILSPGIDFLQKPFTVDRLTTRVREVLDR